MNRHDGRGARTVSESGEGVEGVQPKEPTRFERMMKRPEGALSAELVSFSLAMAPYQAVKLYMAYEEGKIEAKEIGPLMVKALASKEAMANWLAFKGLSMPEHLLEEQLGSSAYRSFLARFSSRLFLGTAGMIFASGALEALSPAVKSILENGYDGVSKEDIRQARGVLTEVLGMDRTGLYIRSAGFALGGALAATMIAVGPEAYEGLPFAEAAGVMLAHTAITLIPALVMQDVAEVFVEPAVRFRHEKALTEKRRVLESTMDLWRRAGWEGNGPVPSPWSRSVIQNGQVKLKAKEWHEAWELRRMDELFRKMQAESELEQLSVGGMSGALTRSVERAQTSGEKLLEVKKRVGRLLSEIRESEKAIEENIDQQVRAYREVFRPYEGVILEIEREGNELKEKREVTIEEGMRFVSGGGLPLEAGEALRGALFQRIKLKMDREKVSGMMRKVNGLIHKLEVDGSLLGKLVREVDLRQAKITELEKQATQEGNRMKVDQAKLNANEVAWHVRECEKVTGLNWTVRTLGLEYITAVDDREKRKIEEQRRIALQNCQAYVARHTIKSAKQLKLEAQAQNLRSALLNDARPIATMLRP